MKDVLIYEDDDFSMIYKEGSLTKEDIEDLKNQVRTILKAKQTEPQMDNGIGCSKCEGRYDCYDRDLPHAIHCNNYGKVTDCAWK